MIRLALAMCLIASPVMADAAKWVTQSGQQIDMADEVQRERFQSCARAAVLAFIALPKGQDAKITSEQQSSVDAAFSDCMTRNGYRLK